MHRLVLFACLCASLPVAAEVLYRWTDDKGVVHYTDQPPPAGRKFEKREVKIEEPAPAPAEAPAETAAAKPSAACERVRQNIKVLEGSGGVSMDLDGDGQAEPLDEATRKRELERSRELEKTLCSP